jgi:hypothetical protein
MPPERHKNPLRRLRQIRDQQKVASDLNLERDWLIKKAVAMKISERQVADAAGLSQPRIHEIAIGDQSPIDDA